MLHFLHPTQVPFRTPRCSSEAAALNDLPQMLDEVLGSFSEEAERFGLFEPPSHARFYKRTAQSHVQRDDQGYSVRVAAPGVPKEHLRLELVGANRLEISAVNPDQSEAAGPETKPRLLQALHLPRDSDFGAITSSYKDGLLQVHVPKATSTTSLEQDPQVAELVADVEERKAKLNDLVAVLQVEQQELREAEQKLRQVRRDAQLRRSQLRQELAIDAVKAQPVDTTDARHEANVNESPAAAEEEAGSAEAGARV
mmetsp:Transcript_7885/g.12532  ORF Transcript_7885/g.12532 Transcript_7885/m.12532 type:complete len:255 (+) Transcript_7885:195-959(+)